MPTIFQTSPHRPTDKGRAAVRSDAFRTACAQIALSTKAQELDYDALEARLRYLAAITLCPKLKAGSEDEFLSFVRMHFQEVENAWRMAVEPTMRQIDTPEGFRGLLAEFGINLPRGG
jgi:hypothetical protein